MTIKDLIAVFLLGVFVLLPYQAKADRKDQLEAMPDMKYCSEVADMFHSGATSQLGGHARVFKQVSPVIIELIEHKLDIPKDAMYVMEWETLTPNERAFMELHVLTGYDEAAKIPGLTDDQALRMAQAYFEHCMYKRTAQKKVASSENLKSEGQICKFDVWVTSQAIRQGISKEKLIAFAMRSKELSESRLEKILEMIEEAYAEDVNKWEERKKFACEVI